MKYSPKVDHENYFRDKLMLFPPWREEQTDLLNGHGTYEDHFKDVQENVILAKKQYDANSELHIEVKAAVDTQTLDNFDEVSPNIESVEVNDANTEPAQSTE